MRKILIFIMLVLLSITMPGCSEKVVVPNEQEETSVENQQEDRQPGNEIILLVRGDLAEHLGVQLEEIKVISVESVEWNDASLGMPGGIAAQVITPGYIITLAHGNTEYIYHTDRKYSFVRITKEEEISEETVHDPEPTIPLLQATVTRVVDGDTIKVNINGTSETIRIIGIDTPETVHPSKLVEPFGPEASAFTRNYLENKQVWLELDVNERCRFGRLLAYVWVEKPTSDKESEVRNKMFNALILLGGYAQISTFPPNVKYVDMFTDFQHEARERNKGLWGAYTGEYGTVVDEIERVNINTASANDLERIAHIGEGRAAEIIRLRPFASLDDLERVSGIGPARVAGIKAEGIAYAE